MLTNSLRSRKKIFSRLLEIFTIKKRYFSSATNSSLTNDTKINIEDTASINTLAHSDIKKNRLEALDGLRAMACFLVLLAHFGIQYQSVMLTFIKKILPGNIGVMF